MIKIVTMRAIDAWHIGKITKERLDALVKEHGLAKGRAYPVKVEIEGGY